MPIVICHLSLILEPEAAEVKKPWTKLSSNSKIPILEFYRSRSQVSGRFLEIKRWLAVSNQSQAFQLDKLESGYLKRGSIGKFKFELASPPEPNIKL